MRSTQAAPVPPGGETLASAARVGEVSTVTVVRIAEVLQSDEALLAALRERGAVPGGQVEATRVGDRVRIGAEDDGLLLEPNRAGQVIVAVG